MKIIKCLVSALLAGLLLVGCSSPAAEAGWNTSETTLTTKLETLGFSEMEELTVGSWAAEGVTVVSQEAAISLSTEARTVSHGDIYTAYVDFPLSGAISKGDTVIVSFAVKNDGESDTNFLVDVFSQGDESRASWLTRSYTFSPTNDAYTEYYIYAVACDSTETAILEFNMGWAAQQISLEYVQATRYSGTIRESMLEGLPLMSRRAENGEMAWHDFFGANEAWRDEAQQMIAQNRMGQLSVLVVDADGNLVEDAAVQVEMLSHDYKFGSATNAGSFLGEDADQIYSVLEDYFNIVTFANDLKWGDPGWKGVGTNQETYDALAYLSDKGMDVHAHVLLWPGTDRDPYDDGVDQTAEYVTSPAFVVSTVRVIQAMQKMTDPSTGYGDGTIGTLREEIDAALYVYDDPEGKILDELTLTHVETVRGMVEELSASLEEMEDTDTSLEEASPSLDEFQGALRGILLEHITDFASYYAQTGAIIEWDVLNEVMNPGSRGVVNAIGEDSYVQDKTKICQDPILVDAFKAARLGAGDDVLLSYNDTQWQSNGQQRIDTYNFFAYLKENDAPVDFFGLQAYVYPQSIGALLNPKDNWDEYDRLWALGISTEITEYSPSGFEQMLPETERLNMFKADFLRDYLTVNFAHPGSIGFIAWGGIPTSGPVSSVFYKLVYDEWWTSEQLVTDANGAAELPAYLGEYQITVTTDDGRQTVITTEHLNANDGTTVIVEITQ